MQEKTMLQKMFFLLAALAICVLMVLDAVALLEKFGGEKARALVATGGGSATGAQSIAQAGFPSASKSTPVSQADVLSNVVGEFVQGQYFHELGEYGFGNTMLVPNITFNTDGTFVFSENTGSGMGNCSGVFSLSSDGKQLTCNVTTADIACPDVILFHVSDDNAIVLGTAMKKSMESDSFILRAAEEP